VDKGKGGNGNGDQPDQEESSSWSCPVCGMGGSCAKGDESAALSVHMSLVHPN
jgi:hypothetical protein